MSGHGDLLIEIGTEELPPTALRRLRDAFHHGIVHGLDRLDLNHGADRAYATPRRLAVVVENLAAGQADREIERRGPAVQAAFDTDGKPTKAAEGFARSCGVEVANLVEIETDKGRWLAYRGTQAGKPLDDLLPEVIHDALNRLPIPKRMRWGAGEAAFVRPVHWAVVLFDGRALEMDILGVTAGRETRGHRFHHPQRIRLASAAEYEGKLEREGRVIVDFDRRRSLIEEQALEAARELGGQPLMDNALLDEVTALVEWPKPIVGSFDERFLAVPPEALISSMQGHQKYFPVVDEAQRLLPRFITISNIDSRDPREVARGNERVIRPRLSDAAFFWDQDRKRPLADRIDALGDIVFQQKLGTLRDKAERVARIGEGFADEFDVSATAIRRAALLARADLLTEMVGEFPELQGVMGRYYAAHDGEPSNIAAALDEQYRPRFARDAVAQGALAQLLAVADRADTLLGIFAIGQAPTGDKDPFALRRAALGLLRTLIENESELDLRTLLEVAATQLPETLNGASHVQAVFDFCMERLRGYYQDQGFVTEMFDAVLAAAPRQPLDFHRRMLGCRAFLELPAASSLAAAHKRISNILRKADTPPGAVDKSRLDEPAEKELYEHLEAAREAVGPARAEGNYEAVLKRLAELREPVDRFFDEVMVMAEDTALRNNRLALLQELRDLFLAVADISRLPSGD